MLDRQVHSLHTCFRIPLLEMERASEPPGIGYALYPGGKPAETIHLLLEFVEGEPGVFRRIGLTEFGERELETASDYSIAASLRFCTIHEAGAMLMIV